MSHQCCKEKITTKLNPHQWTEGGDHFSPPYFFFFYIDLQFLCTLNVKSKEILKSLVRACTVFHFLRWICWLRKGSEGFRDLVSTGNWWTAGGQRQIQTPQVGQDQGRLRMLGNNVNDRDTAPVPGSVEDLCLSKEVAPQCC